MMTSHTLALLSCPACRDGLQVRNLRSDGDLIIEADLHCVTCTADYPVRDGLPNLVPKSRLSGAEWQLWQRHLQGFQARRAERRDKPDALVNRFAKPELVQRTFAEFTGIRSGLLLDVGCGPGKFRHIFEGWPVRYVGLDPIPLPESDAFEYLRAVGEYLPLRDATVDHVTVLASLDHFNDVPAFLAEVTRILKPGGRFHLLQSVHEARGVTGALKWLAHEVKDRLEDHATDRDHSGTPKHMSEYRSQPLRQTLSPRFSIQNETRYSPGLLNPELLFLSMSPKGAAMRVA